MSGSPCYGCGERFSSCHTGCTKYGVWRAELDESNKTAQKAKLGGILASDAKRDFSEKMRRERRLR